VRLNPAAIGLPLGAYLHIRPMPGELGRVAELLGCMPAVVMCDRVTGEDRFIAKALVPSVADLEKLIDRLLPYAATDTSIIVSTPVAQRLPTVG
jgi:Lrp/AsnC family leucine-responsive transcriptional regulator